MCKIDISTILVFSFQIIMMTKGHDSLYNSNSCISDCIDSNKRYCPGDSTMNWGFCCTL